MSITYEPVISSAVNEVGIHEPCWSAAAAPLNLVAQRGRLMAGASAVGAGVLKTKTLFYFTADTYGTSVLKL